MDITTFWKYLGTAWDQFKDKSKIEAIWYGMYITIQRMYEYTYEIQKSRFINTLTADLEVGPETYTIVYSGLVTNGFNVTLTSSGFTYDLPYGIRSIPAMHYKYVYNGVMYSGVYTEGVDYTISGYDTLVWTGSLPMPDRRFPLTSVVQGYAPVVKRINPVLMNLWSRMCGFDIKYLNSYNTFGQDKYLHFKMLIWALVYTQLQAPSIKTLKRAFALCHGYPFAYEAGNFTSSGNTYTVGDSTYNMPAGLIAIPDGPVEQFDILVSGIQLDTYTENPTAVSRHSNIFNRRNTLVYQYKKYNTLGYNTEFATNYMNRIKPVQLTYYIEEN